MPWKNSFNIPEMLRKPLRIRVFEDIAPGFFETKY
jgi:hypothetical protein